MELEPADFRELFDAAPVGLAVLDQELRYVYCNEALATLNGIPARDHIGKTVAEIVPTIAEAANGPFRSVLETGVPIKDIRFSGDVPLLAATPRSWVESVEPIRRNGRVVAILVSVQEVTALEEAQRALSVSEQTLQASQSLNPDGFAILRAVRNGGEIIDLEWEYANPAAQRASIATPLVGRRLLELAPPGGALDLAYAHYVETLSKQGTSTIEFPYENPKFKGWFRSTVISIDSERIAISFADISERKKHEEALTLALQEFRHRVNNLLAVVSSLVGHARRTAATPEAMAETIQRQLKALGAAQNLFSGQPVDSVQLSDVVATALRPFRVASLHVQPGPNISIPTKILLPVTLLLHELATNAMKHGALSSEKGSVTVIWDLKDEEPELSWIEMRGPPVVAPSRTGFGSKLFKMLQRELGDGAVVLDYLPSGLRASIRLAT